MKEEDKDNLKKIGYSHAYLLKPGGMVPPKKYSP